MIQNLMAQTLMVQNTDHRKEKGQILIFPMILAKKQSALMTHSIFPEESLQILEEQDEENKRLLKFTDVTQIPSHDIRVQYLMIQH